MHGRQSEELRRLLSETVGVLNIRARRRITQPPKGTGKSTEDKEND